MSLPEGINNRQMIVQTQIPINEDQTLKKTTGNTWYGEATLSKQQIASLKKLTESQPSSLVAGMTLLQTGSKCISNAWSRINSTTNNVINTLKDSELGRGIKIMSSIKSVKEALVYSHVKQSDEYDAVKEMSNNYKSILKDLKGLMGKDGKINVDDDKSVDKLIAVNSKLTKAIVCVRENEYSMHGTKHFIGLRKDVQNMIIESGKIYNNNKDAFDFALKVDTDKQNSKALEKRENSERITSEQKAELEKQKEQLKSNNLDHFAPQETNSAGTDEGLEEVIDPDWATDDPWTIKEEKLNNIDQNTSTAPETNSASTEAIEDDWENGTDNPWPTNATLEALQNQIDEKKGK